MRDRPSRSWLVVPLSQAAALDQAVAAGADVVVLDLVELVGEHEKAGARKRARAAIERVSGSGARVCIQTTHAEHEADLFAGVCAPLSGVVVSRAESVQQVRDIGQCLGRLEQARGLAPGSIEITVAIETARGNQDAYDIVNASPRVRAATLGRADLIMDLRPEPSGEIHMMPYLMQRLVIIARASGVTPLGAWWRAPDRGLLSTADNTLKAATRGRAAGFKGALCLHAEQVASLNQVYAGE